MRIMLSWVNDTTSQKKNISSSSNRNRPHDLVVTSPESIQMRYSRVYSRAQLCGISAIWKKNAAYNFRCRVKWGAKKIETRISTIFLKIKYSKTSLTTTLIWRPLYKLTLDFYSILLSQLPFSSSFESLFHQTNIRDSAVIRAQAFSVVQNVSKCRQSVGQVWLM